MYLALAKPINTLVINRRGRRFKSCRIDSWQGARRPVDVCSAQTVTECRCRKVWKYRLSGLFLRFLECLHGGKIQGRANKIPTGFFGTYAGGYLKGILVYMGIGFLVVRFKKDRFDTK